MPRSPTGTRCDSMGADLAGQVRLLVSVKRRDRGTPSDRFHRYTRRVPRPGTSSEKPAAATPGALADASDAAEEGV